ncbi:hypothetical protein FSARC_8700 [Fusarium sarcochroum]|uniref:Polyketide cyclase n=1 Tax=Fusarium sarcochroum TaxID=1208366 RepID=A0A8H4TSI8_9HYPO|nr:hypothetical protein FSARC_8700 [Fusarium sarcochroum]
MGQKLSLVVEAEIQAPVDTVRSVKNATDAFEWEGGLWPLLLGEHELSWRPSSKTPGGTTFSQRESWRGLVSFLWGPNWIMGKKTRRNFELFNAEVKKEAERRAAA